jgi:ferredoxin
MLNYRNRHFLCENTGGVTDEAYTFTDSKRSRRNGTECILCLECVNKCPKNAIKM